MENPAKPARVAAKQRSAQSVPREDVRGGATPYHQDMSGCDRAALGRDDLPDLTCGAHMGRMEDAVKRLRAQHEACDQPILAAVLDNDDLVAATAALEALSRNARTLVFFGTGGSSLGGQAIAQVGGWNIPGDRGVAKREKDAPRRPRTRFYDNLDGRTLGCALEQLDLESTRFVLTSKSGNTPETLAQAIAALDAVRRAGLEARIPEMFLAITEPGRDEAANGLLQLCERFSIPTLDHPQTIGGRFSVLSVVGMLPAMARGLDPVAIRRGAKAVVDGLMSQDAQDFAPAVGASAIAALMTEGGVKSFVMMPYCDRLGQLAAWYAQLFGESLGKNGLGGTPVAALGPVDQHSQLQLWMDGPREHMMTFVRETATDDGPVLDPDLAETAGIGYLGDKTAGSLVAAQGKAIPEALRQAGRPHRTFDVDKVDEFTIGGLMMHFMIETMLVGDLLGIDAFDQPAVETGKRLARDLLTRAE